MPTPSPQLLGVDGPTLREALTHRKIIAKGEEVRPGLCFRAAGWWVLPGLSKTPASGNEASGP